MPKSNSALFRKRHLPALALFTCFCLPAFAVDDEAARKLAKQNNCFRCHAVEREKNGPAWADIGTKYKAKPDGEAKLMKHLTSAPKVKLREDGVEEEHKIAKFREEADLKNLVDWILSL
jgi:cytochrome c